MTARAAEWQPIDSATRDGTPNLACVRRPEEHGPWPGDSTWWGVVVRWQSYHPNAEGSKTWRDWNGIRHQSVRWWVPCPGFCPKEKP